MENVLQDTIIALNLSKQTIVELEGNLVSLEKNLSSKEKEIVNLRAQVEFLLQQKAVLLNQHFGSKSEKNKDQGELFDPQEFDSELLEPVDDIVTVPSHKRRKSRKQLIPTDLPEVVVEHDLPESEKTCDCGATLERLNTETDCLKQLAIIPTQFYIIKHVKLKYACHCKSCIKTAELPKQPVKSSYASPVLLGHIMISKYWDGLPFYRIVKMVERSGFIFHRSTLSNWTISASNHFDAYIELLEKVFNSYSIANIDETTLQVLKEIGREATSKSYLWLRCGGPPDKPVAIINYSPSRSGEIASELLSGFNGYLLADGYPGYNQIIKDNELQFCACSDHARRKFIEVLTPLKKKAQIKQSKLIEKSVAQKAVNYFKKLYKIEKKYKHLPPDQLREIRQEKSVPIWKAFKKWLMKVNQEGVIHSGTQNAINYALNRWEALTRYCEDGRLSISNIKAEHIAKTIAVARKNFLFSFSIQGAHASAKIYTILETIKANKHNALHFMTMLLTELPNVKSEAELEALLPWNLTKEEVAKKFNSYPKPESVVG